MLVTRASRVRLRYTHPRMGSRSTSILQLNTHSTRRQRLLQRLNQCIDWKRIYTKHKRAYSILCETLPIKRRYAPDLDVPRSHALTAPSPRLDIRSAAWHTYIVNPVPQSNTSILQPLVRATLTSSFYCHPTTFGRHQPQEKGFVHRCQRPLLRS